MFIFLSYSINQIYYAGNLGGGGVPAGWEPLFKWLMCNNPELKTKDYSVIWE